MVESLKIFLMMYTDDSSYFPIGIWITKNPDILKMYYSNANLL